MMTPNEEQLAARIDLACTMMGFAPGEHVTMEAFYQRLAELVNLEKQMPFFKVVRYTKNANGREAAIVTIDYRGSSPLEYMLMFFSKTDRIRTIKMFWEREEDAHVAYEKGMGLSPGEGRGSPQQREGATDGDAPPTSHRDSGGREETQR